jgi:hypothetical protein
MNGFISSILTEKLPFFLLLWLDDKFFVLPNNTFVYSTIILSGFTTEDTIEFSEIGCWTNDSRKKKGDQFVQQGCMHQARGH